MIFALTAKPGERPFPFPLTVRQKLPFQFVVTVDHATGLSLATYSLVDPAQYAAGLLIRTCKTAAALGCKPDEVPTAAAASSIASCYSTKGY